MTRLGFRHGDRRFPFFWESTDQPPARWHGPGEGPVQYLADTADGAWAEFLRHEEIDDPADLAGIARRLWVVELPEDIDGADSPQLDDADLFGGPGTYAKCQEAARGLRASGARAIAAPSAALLLGGARGQFTSGGLREAPDGDGRVWVLIGPQHDLRGWVAVDAGSPTERVLLIVRHFANAPGNTAERRRSNRRSGGNRRGTLDLTGEYETSDRREPWADRRRGVDRRQSGPRPPEPDQ